MTTPKYRDLNATPKQQMADIVSTLSSTARQPATGAFGRKAMGFTGDLTWKRSSDGREISVREVDEALEDAAQRIEDAEGVLAGAQDRIDTALDAEGHIREDEILRNATLLGETVVQQINITEKLIGKDGVFTGTVDFENVTVTGTQIVNKLGASSISADKVAGGDFTGKTFSGGLFVGAEFQAPASPANNGGIAIDPEHGLRAWNDSGKQTVSIDPKNGDLRMGAGVYLTGPERNGLVLNPPSAIGTASIYFTADDKSMGADDAAIWRIGYNTSREPLMIRGANGAGISVRGATNYFQGTLEVGDTMLVWEDATFQAFLRYPRAPTSGVSSSNVYLNPNNGIFARMTSSRRYKRNIADWSADPEAVLALQPRTWQATTPLEGDDPEAWFVGFVAEEVHDLGLTELVEYGEDGEPDALHYATFSVAQQAVLQKHEEDLARLTARVEELERGRA